MTPHRWIPLLFVISFSACNRQSSAPSAEESAESLPAKVTSKSAEPSVGKKSWEGPFGLQMGLKRGEVEKVVKLESDNGFIFASSTTPRPHDSFKTYVYLFTEEDGLCSVTGVTDEFESNSFGEQVKEKFANLQSALSEKYKTPTFSHDYVARGSIWREPQDWMMGLVKQERRLSATWFNNHTDPMLPKGKKNEAVLPATISSIALEAEASSGSRAKISLRYDFQNIDNCVAALRKAKNKSL